MSLETRNRLLTIIFLLLITLLVGELSYFFFNHRNTFTPVPTPPTNPQTPIINSSPSSITHTFTDSDKINTRLQNFSSFLPNIFPLLTKLSLSYTITGKITKVTPTTIYLKSPTYQKPLGFSFSSHSLKKLQIITPQGQVNHQLTSIPINSQVIITVTDNLLQPNPTNKNLPLQTSIIINIMP